MPDEPTSEPRLALTAYAIAPTSGWGLEPASPRREWMDRTPDKGPYRCLPMVMANQWGWSVLSPATFQATWNGGATVADTKVAVNKEDAKHEGFFASHFGHGIVTIYLPWLFRTSPGYGLLVRGPTNSFKDSAAPLDGVVETDWAPYTFTMNWKLTKRATPVWFQKGEPLCMITPFRLDDAERFDARVAPIESEPALADDYARFVALRQSGLRDWEKGESVFQKRYITGRRPDGSVVDEHRSNFRLARFEGLGG